MANVIGEDNTLNTMRRKAGAGRPAPPIGRLTSISVLATAIAQSAQDCLSLVAAASEISETRTALAPLEDTLPKAALLALIEGPENGYGIVVLDAQTTAALVEVQTTGSVSATVAENRPPTRTDAILAAEFIDRVLEVYEGLAAQADLAIVAAITGYRFATAIGDWRAVLLTLDDIPYRNFQMILDLGQGAKTGHLQLLFPFERARKVPAQLRKDWQNMLQQAVADVPATLTATLLRTTLPIDAISDLEVGTLIPVPRAALGDLRLEDIDGKPVGTGRLGQVGGHRAVCISGIVPETATRSDTADPVRDIGDLSSPRAALQAGPISNPDAQPAGDRGEAAPPIGSEFQPEMVDVPVALP